MSTDDAAQTIGEIESYLPYYTESLNTLRSFIDKFHEIEKSFKANDRDLKVEELSDFRDKLNFLGFLTISILDLLVISRNILLAKYVWERIHNFRLGYLLIYESINLYHEHVGSIKKAVVKHPEMTELFKLLSSNLRDFKKHYEYESTINFIRNKTAAHIERDFQTYYDTVNKIKEKKAFHAIVSFLEILFKMQELSKELSQKLPQALNRKDLSLK